MTQPIHLDFETRSSVDLNSNGVYAYAASPDAAVLCLSVCVGDGDVESWANPSVTNNRASFPPSGDWSEWGGAWDIVCNEISEGDGEIWAHNADFELVIWNRVLAPQFGLKQLDPRRMRCTASLARRAVIPASLEKCATYLNLTNRKDKRGVALIKKFCIPEFDDPDQFPDEFGMLIDYCEQDVEVEREIHAKLKAFDRKVNQKIYLFNALVNETGFPVNTKALKAAQEILVEDKEKLSDRFRGITGLSPTQTTKALEWFQENGYEGEDLRKLTVEEEIEKADFTGLRDHTIEALRLRQLMSLAAVKKIPKMIDLADADERVRGTLMDHGASTGRSSSKLVQQQNFRRSTNASEMFYRAFATNPEGWDANCIEAIHGDAADVFSTSIRHFIHKPGEPLVAVDYAAIECRVVNWVAGQEDAIKEFREGIDRYKVMASRIYGVPVSRISKDGVERFLGKQAVLGCGYQMGASKFQGTCAGYGVEIDVELAEKAVTSFRATHEKVKSFWYDIERAVKKAILSPGNFPCRKVVAFCATVTGIKFLFIKLPSGRLLSYPEPKVVEDRITFFGQLPKSTKWGRCETYGGKITENIVQAISADIMVHGGMVAIENGHEVCMMVHDEAVKLTHGDDPRMEDFIRCLTTLPEWAEGLPLVAEGKVLDFYSK